MRLISPSLQADTRRDVIGYRGRRRSGISLPEILVAMTLLVVVIGGLAVLSARNAQRARTNDLIAARTFVLIQQANRFAAIPYLVIPNFAPVSDTITSGRFRFQRTLAYTQGTTGADYRNITVTITPLEDTRRPDTLVFQRARTWANTPLFNRAP